MEKRPFFRADMAGLGIYHMGGFGRIGVYRDNIAIALMFPRSPMNFIAFLVPMEVNLKLWQL